jgi:hypothetical protein
LIPFRINIGLYGRYFLRRQQIVIVTDVYFWGVFPLLLGPKDARPPVLTFGVLPLMLSSRDVSPFSGPDTSPDGLLRNHRETQQLHAAMQPSMTRFNQVLSSCGAPEVPEFFMDCAYHLPDRFLQLTAEACEYPRSDMKESIQFIGNLMPRAHARTATRLGGIRWNIQNR